MMALLEVNDLTHFFGGLRAVHDFDLRIEKGDVVGLIGPNGAGKSTVFNLITGMYSATEGRMRFKNVDIVGRQPYEIAALGIGRTFQNMRLWRHMTVMEHVKLAQYSKIDYGLIGAFLGTGRRETEERKIEERARDLLAMMGVERFSDERVVNLPYGVQRKVEMARAMAVEPELLLLDEPTAGMNPEEMMEMMDVFRQIHDEFDLAIYLIEHRMKVVMDLCEHIQALNFGEIIAEGTPDEIRSDQAVIEAYLGEEDTI
ncbi:MAG: ABC transporter ATP-binding protein [Anaerolineae bacterium]|jgi:branched-chain amino acid transport system ATP-binding protein